MSIHNDETTFVITLSTAVVQARIVCTRVSQPSFAQEMYVKSVCHDSSVQSYQIHRQHFMFYSLQVVLIILVLVGLVGLPGEAAAIGMQGLCQHTAASSVHVGYTPTRFEHRSQSSHRTQFVQLLHAI